MEPTRNMRLKGLWGGDHVIRMKDETELMKAVKGDKEGRRPTARPSGRWLDAVDREAKNTSKCRTGDGRRQKIEMSGCGGL